MTTSPPKPDAPADEDPAAAYETAKTRLVEAEAALRASGADVPIGPPATATAQQAADWWAGRPDQLARALGKLGIIR